MHRNVDTLTIYQTALKRINQCFKEYQTYPSDSIHGKTLHFTSQQMRNFPNLIKFFQNGPGHSYPFQTEPDRFEKMCQNMKNLKDLKVTCIGEHLVELQQFSSLQNLHIVGPCLREIKGLRSASCNLLSLIVENGDISLNELLSQCCMDESRPVIWPQLLSLKVSNCSLVILDSSLKLLPNLQELDLSFNDLSSIKDELSCLDLVTHLNLGFNFITAIPQFHGGIRWSLQYLYLQYNDLSDLEGLQILESLKDLDVSHNLLIQHITLEPLRHLSKLEKLDLRGNPLCYQSKHRELAARYISSLAMNLEFCLDGKLLTNYDLAEAMYTPIAVQCNQYARQFDTSINSTEPDSYDISMSSAAENVSGLVGGDTYFKLCSNNLKIKGQTAVKRNSGSSVRNISRGEPDHSAGQITFGKSRSTSSSIETLSSNHSVTHSMHPQSASLTKAAPGPVRKRGIEEGHNPGTSMISDGRCNPVISLIAQKISEGEDGKTVEIMMTDNHLLEVDLETGNILESFVFDNLQKVTLLSSNKVYLQFYHPENSSCRLYNFPGEGPKKIRWFFDTLEAIQIQNGNKHCLNCMTCSKTVFTSDLKMVCSCGSGMVILDDKFSKSDSEEAADPETSMEGQSTKVESPEKEGLSIPGHISPDGAVTGLSLSWMHSLQDMPVVGQVGLLQRTDDCHISSSLPAYLSEVLGPYTGSSKLTTSAVSESLLHTTRNMDIPFKSFPNLMPPHEIYKLVEVTPLSDNSIKRGTVEGQYAKSPLAERPFTPQPSEAMSKPDDDDNPEHGYGYKQGMVTSTPRRKIQRSHVAGNIGESPKLVTNLQQPHRSLVFDDESGTSVDDDLWSHHTVSGKLPSNNIWLQQFVEEELLEVGEDLLGIQRSMILRETGKKLVDFVSQSPPSKGFFARNRSFDSGTVSEYPVRYKNCLILITTENLHVLDMPNSRKTGPEHLHTYQLRNIAGVADGLRSMSTLVAVGNRTRERKLDLEHIEQIFTIVFSDSSKCRKFQKLLFESALLQLKDSNVDRTPNKGSDVDDETSNATTSIAKEESTPFSDVLERNFSENVLLYLDLSAPESVPASKSASFNKLVNVDMFTHFHCSLRNGFNESETSVLLVITCSGSISVVCENPRLIMYVYGLALTQTNKGKKQYSLQRENSLIIPKSTIANRSNQIYGIKTSKQCSQMINVIRFANQSDYLQFNFNENEENSWKLKFSGADSVEDVLDLIEQFHQLERGSAVPIFWR